MLRVHSQKCVYILDPRRAARLFGDDKTIGFRIILRAELQCVLSWLTTYIRHRGPNNLQTEKLTAIPTRVSLSEWKIRVSSVLLPSTSKLSLKEIKNTLMLENGFKINLYIGF